MFQNISLPHYQRANILKKFDISAFMAVFGSFGAEKSINS